MEQNIQAQIWAMDRAQLKTIVSIVRERQQQIRQQEMLNFNKGDKVQFITKQGQTIQGVVTQRNRKSIGVSTDAGAWRISPSLLTKVTPNMFGGE